MQFVLILAVLAALGISESSRSEPVASATWNLLAAGCGVAAVTLLAAVGSGLVARGLRADFTRHRQLLRRFARLRRLHVVLWLAVAGSILIGLDWARLVRFNWHLDQAFLLDEILILMPVLLPLVLSWAAFYEVERAVCTALAKRQDDTTAIPSRWQYLATHGRHYFGTLLLPVLALLALRDAVAILKPELLQEDLAAVVFLPAIGIVLLLFPVLLRRILDTRPLPEGPLRSRLERAARRLGVSYRDILIWRTDGMVANAAVAGLVGRWRYIFLSDGLLSRLSDEEIEAAFTHEAGHIRHRHLLLRVAAMALPLSAWLIIRQAFPEPLGPWSGRFAIDAAGGWAPAGLVVVAIMGGYAWVVFGFFARLLEHQADLFAYRALPSGDGRPAVEILASALEKLAAGNGLRRSSRGWQHASVEKRIDFLRKVDRAPKRELRFQRRVLVLSSLAVGFAVSPVLCRLLLS